MAKPFDERERSVWGVTVAWELVVGGAWHLALQQGVRQDQLIGCWLSWRPVYEQVAVQLILSWTWTSVSQ